VLETFATTFLAIWLLGIGSAYTLGGLIDVFLVLAVILTSLRISKGRSRP
jgi:hypothetical protein